ncbi:MAG: hypothetical protein KBD83_04420 [Gammaproteobacteria bacterium]|nr:hypothetical protein [Gammaproteobacteria bacterium]
MSLIIAEVSENDGFYVADTLISHQFEDPRIGPGPFNGKFHALKVHILNENLCIALAGDYSLGIKIVSSFATYLNENKQRTGKELIQSIFTLYQEECLKQKKEINVCEFLVMCNIDDHNILAKISENGVEYFETTYIGNCDAYRRLQSLRQLYVAPSQSHNQQPDGTFKWEPLTISDLEKNFFEITEGMEKISEQNGSMGVASLSLGATRVRINKAGKFEYLQTGMRGTSPWENSIGISQLTSMFPKYGVGMFFQGAKIGYVFISGDIEYCRKIEVGNIKDFIKFAYDNYQLAFTGVTW